MRGPEGGYGLMHAERASVSRRLPRSFGPDNAPAEKDRTSPRVPPTSSLHTLSVSGADHPSSRYHPLRFCLSAIPTCRYLPLLDIAFHVLHNARYPKLGKGFSAIGEERRRGGPWRGEQCIVSRGTLGGSATP